jgi:membrane protease YdiL (CAAX protease family)
MEAAPRARGVLIFLLISFTLTWAWEFTARLGLGLSLVNPLVQAPVGFVPAIAAVVVRRWVTREGFPDAGLALRLRPAWRYYLAAWALPWAFVAVATGLAAALGLAHPVLSRLAVSGLPAWAVLLLLIGGVPLLAPIYWGEEFGWTGYLRLRIFPERPVLSVTATGLIWAAWHYPLAFLGYVTFPEVVIGLASWTLWFLFQEVILAWMRLASGTIWTTSVAHAGTNMVASLVTGLLLAEKPDPTATDLLFCVPYAAVCAWLLLTGRLARIEPLAGARQVRRPVEGRVAAE